MYCTLFVIGILIGICATILFYSMRKPSGTLKIDRSDPERDKYLEVYRPSIRTFAEHYKAHLAEHFAAMKDKNNKKERTTA